MTDKKHNTGNYNTSYCNTGDRNTGYWNTGDCNSGEYNTGNWNAGNRNAGNWNTGDWNTGYCNTITPDDCLIFNKPAKREDWIDAKKPDWMQVALTKWVHSKDMADKEKDAYPSYVTTGGYLKAYSSLQDAYKESWENTTPEDRAFTRDLPNFDDEVFKEIFGFSALEDRESCDGKIVEIDGIKYKLKELGQ